MSKLDVEKICRLCGEKKGRMRSLFEQRQEYPLSLQQIISDVSRLEVEPNDGMPQKACTWCVTTLLKVYKSVEAFRANDLKLRQQLGEMLQVEIKVEEEEMDIEILEKGFTQDLDVEGIGVQENAVEVEYLDSENNDSGATSQQNISENVPQKQDISDTENEEDFVDDDDDNEWKPVKEVCEIEYKTVPLKNIRRKTTKQQKDAKDKPKSGRRRRKDEDPNRPRLRDYKCYICKSESHGSSEALIAHLSNNHENELPFTCPECVMDTVVIKTVLKLNAHIRQHLNPEKCPHCDKRLSDKSGLAQHIQTYHPDGGDQGPLACKYCGEVYGSKASLIHHMKLHTTAASCEICGKVFRERLKLRLHIQRKHEKLKKHECSICKKKLASLDSLQIHMKSMHSTKGFKCSYCPKTYSTELSLRYHEKKHMENPEYVVKKDWKEYYTIVEGEENKPGVKLKKCNLCGLVSKAVGTHLATVHFPSEFRCTICGVSMKNKQRFEIHVLEHEKGKAQQCPICNREFSDRKCLIAHLRTKQHQGHPLAKSLDWLGYKAAEGKTRMPQSVDGEDAQEQYVLVEKYESEESS